MMCTNAAPCLNETQTFFLKDANVSLTALFKTIFLSSRLLKLEQGTTLVFLAMLFIDLLLSCVYF